MIVLNNKKRLSADLRVILSNYSSIFRDSNSKASLALLNKYLSPLLIIAAQKDDIIKLLRNNAKRSVEWCEKIYLNLISVSKEAIAIGFCLDGLSIKVKTNISIINAITLQLDLLMKNIDELINSEGFNSDIKDNILLLTTIPSIGYLTAITLVAEIGDFNRFKSSKHLVAFLGVDPSINESGKFKGSKNSISKRGSSSGRRALYVAALLSISIKRNGVANNAVILEYYRIKLKLKKLKLP